MGSDFKKVVSNVTDVFTTGPGAPLGLAFGAITGKSLGEALTGEKSEIGRIASRATREAQRIGDLIVPDIPEVPEIETQALASEADRAFEPLRPLFRRSQGNRAFRIPLNRTPGLSIRQSTALPTPASLRIF